MASPRRSRGIWILLVVVAAVAASCADTQVVTVRSAQPFAEHDGVSLLLDVYRPEGTRTLPGLLLIHGGGWESGARIDVAPLGRVLAQDGFVVVAPDYRLAPTYPFPAAFEDVTAAVRWMRDHASDFDVDPTRIAALGVSAGGHLAALLAVHGAGPNGSMAHVGAVASWSGPLDLPLTIDSASPTNRATLVRMIGQFLACPALDCPNALQAASPAAHVDASDAALLIVTSEREATPVLQARTMARRLADAGVEHRLIEVPGGRHAEDLTDVVVPGSPETVVAASSRFLHDALGPGPTRSNAGGIRRSSAPATALAAVVSLGVAIGIITARRRRARPTGPAAVPGDGVGPGMRAALDGALLALIDGLARDGLTQRAIGSQLAARCRRPRRFADNRLRRRSVARSERVEPPTF